MNKVFILIFFLQGCSSLKRSMVYGGLAGGMMGGIAGNVLSPNPESRTPNIAVWGSVGALIGAGLGYYFFNDDPENQDLPNMILPSNQKELTLEGKLQNTIIIPKDSRKYQIERGPIPEHLKGKVKNPFVIEHVIPERVEEFKNGKTITIEAHKAWEVSFE
jgi:hypothetical protein